MYSIQVVFFTRNKILYAYSDVELVRQKHVAVYICNPTRYTIFDD